MNGTKNNLVYDLKYKAKIPVSKSVILLGVIDHTGTLEANEIFLQVNKNDFNHVRYY